MIKCTDPKFGFEEHDKDELNRGGKMVDVLNYPKPIRKFKLVYQSFNQSIEEIYFWLLASLREDFGLHDVIKIKDVFTASEQSAFWGQSQQRMSIQQGQVSNYLATIGKLTKELFQIVRELRILDERLDVYEESNKTIRDTGNVHARRLSDAAEIVLKGYWVDLKDGGVKSPGSVYGLAGTLGYTALPDIFFAAPAMKADEVNSYVDHLKFNPKLKNVLRRKLHAYVVWKDHTYAEVKNRKQFTVKFLRQHYNAIQLYINWIKPYLRNVKRLSQNFEKTMSEDLIGSFEGSVTELEVLCKRKEGDHHNAVVLLTILFRTQPHMDFHQEGYQHKGPVHVGRSEITMRGYAWTDKEIENFVSLRDAETFDMLGDIDKSLQESIDALGDDLRKYLKDKGEEFPEDVKEREEKEAAAKKSMENLKGAIDPFMAIFSGFKEIFTALFPMGPKKDKSEPTKWELSKDSGKAKGAMQVVIWNTYKNFKKAHRMFTW
ncbi:MAG: hypothetical protein V1729_03925 [Candidatus Woesearchaeota archaeon]